MNIDSLSVCCNQSFSVLCFDSGSGCQSLAFDKLGNALGEPLGGNPRFLFFSVLSTGPLNTLCVGF